LPSPLFPPVTRMTFPARLGMSLSGEKDMLNRGRKMYPEMEVRCSCSEEGLDPVN
jgi:hypothetical protein